MTSNQCYVILVNEQDEPIGISEKMEAHQNGLLHRAFSVLVFNDKKEILLQRRALHKYHSPGLWTNTCCSHPNPNEETASAAHRRLIEEMNIDCSINKLFDFVYTATFDNGLTEYEFDHVYIGKYNDNPVINPLEVAEYKWVPWSKLLLDIEENKDCYTVWFQILCNEIRNRKQILFESNCFHA